MKSMLMEQLSARDWLESWIKYSAKERKQKSKEMTDQLNLRDRRQEIHMMKVMMSQLPVKDTKRSKFKLKSQNQHQLKSLKDKKSQGKIPSQPQEEVKHQEEKLQAVQHQEVIDKEDKPVRHQDHCE